MRRLNNKGFGVIEGLLIVVIIGLIGGVGYFVYNANKKASDGNEGTTIVKNENKEAKDAAPEADPNEGYLVVKEWGVRFKVPEGLEDVEYSIKDNASVDGDDVAGFYAKPTGYDVEYRSDYSKFEDGGFAYSIGNLHRSSEKSKDGGFGAIEGKKLGNYYYYTSHAFSGLATGGGAAGLYYDESCEDNFNLDKCDKLLEAENEAFNIVNGNMLPKGNKGLLNTIELAQ